MNLKKELIEKTGDIVFPSFTLTGDGLAVKGSPSFQEWKEVGRFLQRAEGAVQWWIGDWLAYGEGRQQEWGSKYKDALKIFNRPLGTLEQYKRVSLAYKNRKRLRFLDWSHHQIVADLPDEERQALLEEAQPDKPDQPAQLSASQLRERKKELQPDKPKRPIDTQSFLDEECSVSCCRKKVQGIVTSVVGNTLVIELSP